MGPETQETFPDQTFLYNMNRNLESKSRKCKLVPTQWASTLVTALEPSVQTNRVEGMFACCAPFVRCLHIRRNDRVANGTLALALQCALNVLAEC